jgi:hypothetical protein
MVKKVEGINFPDLFFMKIGIFFARFFHSRTGLFVFKPSLTSPRR